MVPPNVHETPVFLSRVKALPGLRNAVIRFLINWPDSGVKICGTFLKVDVPFDGHVYIVLVRRVNQLFSVLGVYDLPAEQKLLDLRIEELRSTFCRGQQ